MAKPSARQICGFCGDPQDSEDSGGSSQLLPTIAHELRTPLTAMAGYGELLCDGMFGPLNPLQADAVERMRAVTHQLSVTIEELLVYANLNAGRERMVLDPPFDAVGIAEEAASLVRPYAARRGVVISDPVDFSVSPVYLESDKDKIRKILLYLIKNAVKYSPLTPEQSGFIHPHSGNSPNDPGLQTCSDPQAISDAESASTSATVEVRCWREGKTVYFTVQDYGLGIPSEYFERVFEPFFQLHSGLTRSHGGVGLGLYLARELAEIIGGRIWVESEPGAGTLFGLAVPA